MFWSDHPDNTQARVVSTNILLLIPKWKCGNRARQNKLFTLRTENKPHLRQRTSLVLLYCPPKPDRICLPPSSCTQQARMHLFRRSKDRRWRRNAHFPRWLQSYRTSCRGCSLVNSLARSLGICFSKCPAHFLRCCWHHVNHLIQIDSGAPTKVIWLKKYLVKPGIWLLIKIWYKILLKKCTTKISYESTIWSVKWVE
jgi:hypothetical protein